MRQTSIALEIRDIAQKLNVLKDKNPMKFYEFKGRINALYENEVEKNTTTLNATSN